MNHDGSAGTALRRAPTRLARVGFVARFRPPHLGHAAILEALARNAETVVVGIGSANRYDLDNPFTGEETAELLRPLLPGGRVELHLLPDLFDGPRWAEMVRERFGALDLFATANPYVRSLVEGFWRVVPTLSLLEPGERVAVDGRAVRRAMARGEAWERLVPPEVARELRARGLARRFREEFGLETIAREAPRMPAEAGGDAR
ncbi:MAG: adenylyltransferase/cytidyltransferase family protein [Thermoanaerobaculia bacterium]